MNFPRRSDGKAGRGREMAGISTEVPHFTEFSMSSFAARYATPLITGLFLVSLISGIALFFHVRPGAFHGMHEWLSMVLILPFALHLWKNWRPMTGYLRRMPMAVSLALSVVAAGLFFMPSGSEAGRSGPPQFQLAATVLTATPAVAAPLFGLSEQGLMDGLAKAGLSAAQPGMTLGDIAVASGKSDAELAAALVALKP